MNLYLEDEEEKSYVTLNLLPDMYQEKLKRCGIALLIVGVLDVAYMAWSISRSQSSHTTFNIFAIIAGFFLVRGSLKAAKWSAYFGSFLLVVGVGGFLVTLLAFPFAYTIASWKFQAHGAIYSVVMGIISVPLLFWICKELLSPDVIDAQKAAQIKPANIKLPVIVGVVATVVLGVFFFKVTRGETAEKAVQLAEKELEGAYHYQVTNLGINMEADPKTGTSHKTISAVVAAYNKTDFKTIAVNWKE